MFRDSIPLSVVGSKTQNTIVIFVWLMQFLEACGYLLFLCNVFYINCHNMIVYDFPFSEEYQNSASLKSP